MYSLLSSHLTELKFNTKILYQYSCIAMSQNFSYNSTSYKVNWTGKQVDIMGTEYPLGTNTTLCTENVNVGIDIQHMYV